MRIGPPLGTQRYLSGVTNGLHSSPELRPNCLEVMIFVSNTPRTSDYVLAQPTVADESLNGLREEHWITAAYDHRPAVLASIARNPGRRMRIDYGGYFAEHIQMRF